MQMQREKTYRKWRGTERASEESQDDERLDVLGPRSARVEGRQDSVCANVKDLSPKKLGQRRPDQRSNRKTQDEQTDAKRDHLLTDPERGQDLVDTAGEGAGHESDGQGSDCDEEGDGPLLPLGPEHRVARVVVDPGYHERVLLCASALVFPVQNVLCYDALFCYQPPVRYGFANAFWLAGLGVGHCGVEYCCVLKWSAGLLEL